jgi:hypothetical protein
MSTDYRPLSPIRVADLFDGRLEKVGVREYHSLFARWANNGDPHYILRSISDEFDVDIVSEYEPQYWGFETEDEWNAALAKMEEDAERDFLNEVVKFVRGEDHKISSGTVGMAQAEIVKRLIAENPHLAVEAKLPDLINAVRTIYDRTGRLT